MIFWYICIFAYKKNAYFIHTRGMIIVVAELLPIWTTLCPVLYLYEFIDSCIISFPPALTLNFVCNTPEAGLIGLQHL